jgi:hypothetical protein
VFAAGLALLVCLRLPAGTPVYSKPDAGARAGVAVAATVGSVGEKDGAFVKLDVAARTTERGMTSQQAHVGVFVEARGLKPGKCLPEVNLAMIELKSELLGLRWKDGSEAGGMRTSSAVKAASRSKDYVTLDGERYVCFDQEIAGVEAHVCGACAVLQEMAGHMIGGILDDTPAKPCAD